MSREDYIRLIARAHRCTMDQAEEISRQLESGERKPLDNEALLRKAGVKRSDPRKDTRPLSRVNNLGVSLEWPTRPGQHRDNGQG